MQKANGKKWAPAANGKEIENYAYLSTLRYVD